MQPEHPPATLSLRLFGPFEARVNGAPLSRLSSRKGQALLALLALRHDTPLSRTWLAGTLWPDSDEPHALANLRDTLKGVRRALGPAADRLTAPTPRTLSLSLQSEEVDVLAFDAAFAGGEDAALDQALAHYRGPLLEWWTDSWVLQEREAREQAYLAALERLAAHATARHEPAVAERYLRGIVAADPLRESAQRALMESLDARGQYAAAVEVYRDLRLLLHRELHVEPAPETSALFDHIRNSHRARATVGRGERARGRRDEGGTAAPRSGDLASSVAHSFRPPPPPSRIPKPLTPLIGREQAVSDVRTALARARLVTLTGSGGVGKTRLAIAVAEEVAEEYADGVWFVELGALAEGTLVARAVADVLGVTEQAGRPMAMVLAEFIQSQQILLLLDNCEHLLEPCVHLVERLLPECPNMRLLATSRQAMGLLGERVWRVPSLGFPTDAVWDAGGAKAMAASGESVGTQGTSDESLAVLIEAYPAVRLFIERAAAAEQAWALTNGTAGAVAAICGRLEGIPLAIELAAAWVAVLPVEQIAARLRDRFDLLTAGGRSGLTRHQSLGNAIAWSYDLLAVDEQVLLRRLSVFAGSWALGAAVAICAPDPTSSDGGAHRKSDATEHLCHQLSGDPVTAGSAQPCQRMEESILSRMAALLGKSLLRREETPDGEARFTMLETVREFGMHQLGASGEARAISAQHAAYFAAWAEKAKAGLRGKDPSRWLASFDAEHGNLRAALEWLADAGKTQDGLRLACTLNEFWQRRQFHEEAWQQYSRLLMLEGARHREPLRARALAHWSWLAHSREDYGAMRAGFEEMLSIAREIENPGLMVGALAGLGWAINNQADRPGARAALEEGLAIVRRTGDQSLAPPVLYHLGAVLHAQGEYGAARRILEESVIVSREYEQHSCFVWSLLYLGRLAESEGNRAEAQAHYEEMRAVSDQLGIQEARWWANLALGDLAVRSARDEEAVALFEEMLRVVRSPYQRGHLLEKLGIIAHRRGELDQAAAHYEAALALNRSSQSQRRSVALRLNAGDLALQQGEYRRAEQCFMDALVLMRERVPSRRPELLAVCFESLARLAAVFHQPKRGARLCGAAAHLREQLGVPLKPESNAELDQCVALLQAKLGEEAFRFARLEGEGMMRDEAIDYALIGPETTGWTGGFAVKEFPISHHNEKMVSCSEPAIRRESE